MITYGPFEIKGEWKKFLDTLSQRKVFLHRDEFIKKYPKQTKISLPAIFAISDGNVNELVSTQEINQEKDIAGLKELLLSKIRGS